MTLVVLARWGWREAVGVAAARARRQPAARPVPRPGFFLSLSGALASLVSLGLAVRLPARWFGPVSHSILAAFAHIGAQLVVARLWLVPHDGVFYLTPVFALAAVVFGLINGLIAARCCASCRLRSGPRAIRWNADPLLPSNQPMPARQRRRSGGWWHARTVVEVAWHGIAVVSGLVFGWVAGSGLVHAAPSGCRMPWRYPPAQCGGECSAERRAKVRERALPAVLGPALRQLGR